MSANASHLIDPHFGYDMVLATTQASINQTMKSYLKTVQGRQINIIVTSVKGSSSTNLISWDDFQKQSNGADPFTIPNGALYDDNKDMQNIKKARFKAGIRITLGLPENFDADQFNTLPDIVNLADGASAVTYRMLCANIVITAMNYDEDGPLPYVALSQNKTRNKAWTVVSKVNMVLNKSNKEFAALPKAVQDQLKNMSGSMFDVSQLLFDLNNANLMTLPQIDGLDAGSDEANLLSKYFCNKYFTEMQTAGQPILAYTCAPTQQTSTFKPTDMNFHVSPLIKETDATLKTLDYIMSINGKPLPPGTDFTWDWLSAEDAKEQHGVISINRDTFRAYIKGIIFDQAKRQVFVPRVRNWLDGFLDSELWFECHPDYPAVQDGDLKVTDFTTGSDNKLFTISYYSEANDEAGVNGALGAIQMSWKYDCSVTASGNKIVATSSFVVHLFIRGLQNKNDANIVSKNYVDTFELSINGAGQLFTKNSSTNEDHSTSDSVNDFSNFFADVNSVFNALKKIAYVGNQFQGTKINELSNFVFPGAKTFLFRDFRFSDYQDLVCGIKYVDPPSEQLANGH